MGFLDFLRRTPGKPDTPIDRSIEEIQLGASIEEIEHDPHWEEISGPDKMIFDSGISGERLFTTSSGTPRVCGFIKSKIYKIAMAVDGEEAESYMSNFSQKYGRPNKPKKGTYSWEDKLTSLEVNLSKHQANIMLTDKGLLLEAMPRGRMKPNNKVAIGFCIAALLFDGFAASELWTIKRLQLWGISGKAQVVYVFYEAERGEGGGGYEHHSAEVVIEGTHRAIIRRRI